MKEFVKLVKQMREWQCRYFRTRSNEALQKSKELETKADAIVAELTISPTIFDD